MKIQHLAILFVLIIVPISMIMASYIQNQVDAIRLQASFDAYLINATHDAMKAFQLNTTNNMYSSISDSKIRDIQATVNTFYNSLNTSMGKYAQNVKDLEAYVPAILFTLYDGYYIYTSFDNVYSEDENTGKVKLDVNSNKKENGLKPYVYYSAKYQLGTNNIIVVNYTLDNLITVYGDVKGQGADAGYQTKTGYLIDPEDVVLNSDGTVTYAGVNITQEDLKEHLLFIDNENTANRDKVVEGTFTYVYYKNQKVYWDESTQRWFWYQNYTKTEVKSPEIIKALNDTQRKSDSAYRFYSEAKEFSIWVNKYLGNIKQKDLISFENGTTPIGSDLSYLSENTGDEPIFKTIANDSNNPMVSESTFNNHRLAVIRKSMESTLNSAIQNYSSKVLYRYQIPVMSNEDWYSILNNVSMVTFLEGMSIGYRVYNNYAIITNNINKEVVTTRNIYLIAKNNVNGSREYHQPGCKELFEGLKDGSLTLEDAGYPTASFQRQTIRVGEDSTNDQFYYLQDTGTSKSETLTGCYNCIVGGTSNYDIDDIIEGKDLIDFTNSKENGGNNNVSYTSTDSVYKKIRTTYLKALARERYDIYKTNFDLDATR